MPFFEDFIKSSVFAVENISETKIESIIDGLLAIRNSGGRLFFCGSGGGAGNSSHAVADFRRLAGIESYAVGDNVSELTALINDISWKESYVTSLKQSNFSKRDGLIIFSVGGGDASKGVSTNLVSAMEYASKVGAWISGVVTNGGGHLDKVSNSYIGINLPNGEFKTPIVESMQVLVWHLLISHPRLAVLTPHWETLEQKSNH